ncbi:endo-1,4-beta-xylanase [Colwellia sp. C1TZA3]|uniref:endo-1,4-beta-xylanase n=1 Tax=Colwellia sp. C1TZA3 TaxID=2508879 RepID=UPI0011BA31E5|nr:endo-1,4-beta-xylanase [Colwellia sp. C1TZA3]TWX70429.1 endo-1,4-beta-xylanase [Colwellia sp. C1TZA3]
MKIYKISHLAIIATLAIGVFSCSEKSTEQVTEQSGSTVTLKEAYADKFLVGATLGASMFTTPNHPSLALAKENFSAVTLDNDMKWERINPLPGKFNFEIADQFAQLGVDENISTVGHVLFWHSQTPDWVFKDDEGNLLTRDALLERMRERAKMFATRYGSRIKIWDVVNEAIEDDGTLRKSLYNQIIGDDFIEQAFIIADQEMPKDATLIYNDYGMNRIGRRDTVLAMVKEFQQKGVRIDGIGLQGHWGMVNPSAEIIDTTLTLYAATGLRLHITELDVDFLGRDGMTGADVDIEKLIATPENNPYSDGNVPAAAEDKFAARYKEIFQTFIKHQKSIDRVTFWGVTDGDSWLNGWPVVGRTNYPLLFKRDGSAKKAHDAVIDLVK